MSNPNAVLLACLSLPQLREKLLEGIRTNNVDLVKILLTDDRLDLQKSNEFDPMNVSTRVLSNYQMRDVLSVYNKNLEKEILDILLEKYDKIDYSKPAVRKIIPMNDYFSKLKSSVEPICLTLPFKSDIVVKPITYAKSGVNTDFVAVFNMRSGNIVKKIDWTNIIIAGEFVSSIRGLPNAIHLPNFIDGVAQMLFENSTIDIYVCGSSDKLEYVIKYFEQFNATYIVRDSKVYIYVPKSKHLIQIIPSDGLTPIEIINSFEFNYDKMYYDGNSVNTNVMGLIACRYALAIYTPNKNSDTDINKLIYKTFLRGFKIRPSDELKAKSALVTSEYIDIRSLEKDTNLMAEFKNVSFMIKTLAEIDPTKQSDFIKLMFGAKSATNHFFLKDEKV